MQQHFNDLSLRVRNFAITVMTAVLGAAGLAFREAPQTEPWIIGAGLLAWLAFYMMDAFWYHRLLVGSVVHGEAIEKELAAKGISGFGLTGAIRAKSPVKVLRWEWHSTGRLHGFYLTGLVLVFVLGVGAWTTQNLGRGSLRLPTARGDGLSARPALLFPPNGATLKPAESVAFGWQFVEGAARYRLEVQTEGGAEVVSMMLAPVQTVFVGGPDVLGAGGRLRWRSVPTDEGGAPIGEVEWISFEILGSETP